MNGSPLHLYEDQYRNALLYEQNEKINSLKEKIKNEYSSDIARKIFAAAEQWKDQCHSLTDQAVAFAKNGGTRKDLQFDELEKKPAHLAEMQKLIYVRNSIPPSLNIRKIRMIPPRHLLQPNPVFLIC